MVVDLLVLEEGSSVSASVVVEDLGVVVGSSVVVVVDLGVDVVEVVVGSSVVVVVEVDSSEASVVVDFVVGILSVVSCSSIGSSDGSGLVISVVFVLAPGFDVDIVFGVGLVVLVAGPLPFGEAHSIPRNYLQV